jgi:hypothetical protein
MLDASVFPDLGEIEPNTRRGRECTREQRPEPAQVDVRR